MPEAHLVSTAAAIPSSVSVVVCTHTVARRQILGHLIDSIAAGTVKPVEVVVVVDRNRPLFEALTAATWPLSLRVIESRGSGLSAARNAGWQTVTSPLVAFIDDDAVATPGWLAELTNAADRHGADVVGGAIEPLWNGDAPGWYSRYLGWVVGCSYEGLPREAARVRNVIGCNMLFRRELLDRLEGFDTTLGRTNNGLAGCEETELCIRANRAGAAVVLIPGAQVSQVLPADRRRFRYAVRRGWDEGRSKRMLVAMHGRVLATESSYARALLRQALVWVGTGIVGRHASDIRRAAALIAVLTSTTASYLLHGLRRPTPRVVARPPVTAING
ncbi:MAG TPA: glycosyltransferase [Candidatus Dormibacteraeota bacterium]|nr:glycosyltransferase [Candidatus Dormibacteraeota bacterium]